MHGFFPFPFLLSLSFHFIFFLTSTGQTGEPISIVEGSNDTFTPKEVPFGISLKKFGFTAWSITHKNHQNVGVVYGFPSKLGESIKTHISVKSRDIGKEFEL
jgi:hypothetical protein